MITKHLTFHINGKQNPKKLLLFQEKAVRLISFQPQILPSNNQFKQNKIFKISKFVDYKCTLFLGIL